MNGAWIVFVKEVVDALRDRKSLVMLLLAGVLMGPLMLGVISIVVNAMEEKAERREIAVLGIERAPELKNFFLRQGLSLVAAPADYEVQLHDSRLTDPVVVIPEDYAKKLANGEKPEIRIVFDSANKQSEMLVKRAEAVLQGYRSEMAALELALRGVAPAVLEPFAIQRHNLADQQSRSAGLTGMVPWMVLIAVLIGAVTVALDTTAGERERASLQPLLTNPVPLGQLVLGKWAASAAMAMAIALFSVASFFPGQWLIQSESLQALFRFGPAEGALFLLMLLPLAAAVAALFMLVAIHGKTFKEAQTSASMAMMGLQMLPLIGMVSLSGEKPWYLWVPSLAQQTVMLRVLRGDPLEWTHLVIPSVVSVMVTVVCLVVLARKMKDLALR